MRIPHRCWSHLSSRIVSEQPYHAEGSIKPEDVHLRLSAGPGMQQFTRCEAQGRQGPNAAKRMAGAVVLSALDGAFLPELLAIAPVNQTSKVIWSSIDVHMYIYV